MEAITYEILVDSSSRRLGRLARCGSSLCSIGKSQKLCNQLYIACATEMQKVSSWKSLCWVLDAMELVQIRTGEYPHEVDVQKALWCLTTHTTGQICFEPLWRELPVASAPCEVPLTPVTPAIPYLNVFALDLEPWYSHLC